MHGSATLARSRPGATVKIRSRRVNSFGFMILRDRATAASFSKSPEPQANAAGGNSQQAQEGQHRRCGRELLAALLSLGLSGLRDLRGRPGILPGFTGSRAFICGIRFC